jgi:uracil-DNA glycosylase family 4
MKQEELKKIEEEIAACEKCGLCKTRTNTVPGYGSAEAEILFIGEGPGKNEDEQGRPFVGAAGKILESMLGEIGLTREDVFITNVVKCRPPMNRDPLPEEVEACYGYLEKQVDLIKPKIIVLLGRHAMDRFLPGLKISLDHGKPKRRNGQVYYPIYHPAATIYHQALRVDLEKDFKRIPKVIEALGKEIPGKEQSLL